MYICKLTYQNDRLGIGVDLNLVNDEYLEEPSLDDTIKPQNLAYKWNIECMETQ